MCDENIGIIVMDSLFEGVKGFIQSLSCYPCDLLLSVWTYGENHENLCFRQKIKDISDSSNRRVVELNMTKKVGVKNRLFDTIPSILRQMTCYSRTLISKGAFNQKVNNRGSSTMFLVMSGEGEESVRLNLKHLYLAVGMLRSEGWKVIVVCDSEEIITGSGCDMAVLIE